MSNNEFFGTLGFFAGLAGICFFRKISNKINSDMNSRVKEAVDDRFNELSKKTSSLVAKEISGWDLTELRREVKEDARDKIAEKLKEEIDDAKEKAHEKFEEKLDSILDSYDGKLTTEFKYELLKKLL